MFINADTLHSLGIIDAETHPHSHNRGPNASSGAKEGLSVYGLFHHLAGTSQGRFLLRQCFLRPSLNIDVINERLDAVSILSRSENASTLDSLVQNMKNIGNMRVIMINLRKGVGGSISGKSGLSRSVWTAVRGVRPNVTACDYATNTAKVCFSCTQDEGRSTRYHRWRQPSNTSQGV